MLRKICTGLALLLSMYFLLNQWVSVNLDDDSAVEITRAAIRYAAHSGAAEELRGASDQEFDTWIFENREAALGKFREVQQENASWLGWIPGLGFLALSVLILFNQRTHARPFAVGIMVIVVCTGVMGASLLPYNPVISGEFKFLTPQLMTLRFLDLAIWPVLVISFVVCWACLSARIWTAPPESVQIGSAPQTPI